LPRPHARRRDSRHLDDSLVPIASARRSADRYGQCVRNPEAYPHLQTRDIGRMKRDDTDVRVAASATYLGSLPPLSTAMDSPSLEGRWNSRCPGSRDEPGWRNRHVGQEARWLMRSPRASCPGACLLCAWVWRLARLVGAAPSALHLLAPGAHQLDIKMYRRTVYHFIMTSVCWTMSGIIG
jgi:hypothetical protein